jgi:choline dehydrogenase-like flavoprotein
MPLNPEQFPNSVDVVIIGAGSAEAVIAWRLLDAVHRVAVLESSATPGSQS